MALPDELQALIDESTRAGARMAEGMRDTDGTDRDRNALLSDIVGLNANVGGIENAIRALAVKVEELSRAGGGDA